MSEQTSGNSPAQIRGELEEQHRKSAELMRALGSRATEDVDALVSVSQAIYAVETSIAERKQEDVEQVHRFLNALPNVDANSIWSNKNVIPAPDLVTARLIQASVWSAGNVDDDRTSHKPVHVIGYSHVKHRSKYDTIKLLVTPAEVGEHRPFNVLYASMGRWQRAQWLAIQKLSEPVTGATIDDYLTPDKNGFQARIKAPTSPSMRKSYVKGLEVTLPKDEDRLQKYWLKHDEKLATDGVIVSHDWSVSAQMKPENILDFNMDIECHRLATVFGIEDIYDDTFGRLSSRRITQGSE